MRRKGIVVGSKEARLIRAAPLIVEIQPIGLWRDDRLEGIVRKAVAFDGS